MDIDTPPTGIERSNIIYKKQTSYPGSSFVIAIIFLIICLAMIIITVFYFLFWKPFPPSPSCETNINCPNGQICQLGVCVEIICNSDSDCPNNSICIQAFPPSLNSKLSYCYPLSCNIGNDCPKGTSCLSGTCINIGTPCTSNSDCFQLTCINNVCVQCLSNSDCPIGQGCFNQSCRYPYDNETSPNMITYFSPAQNNGNIVAPPSYFCSSSNCGVSGQNLPIPCDSFNDICPITCQYCVNNYCRCTQGQLYEQCHQNTDCLSGLCTDTKLGKICVPAGGECAFNYNGSDCKGCCTVNAPYCVNGKCSDVSLYAICGGNDLPPDMCNNPLSLGAIGTTGITNDGMGFFCVNGTCQNTPGSLNTLCSGDSCEFIHNGALVCTHMRCLPLT